MIAALAELVERVPRDAMTPIVRVSSAPSRARARDHRRHEFRLRAPRSTPSARGAGVAEVIGMEVRREHARDGLPFSSVAKMRSHSARVWQAEPLSIAV